MVNSALLTSRFYYHLVKHLTGTGKKISIQVEEWRNTQLRHDKYSMNKNSNRKDSNGDQAIESYLMKADIETQDGYFNLKDRDYLGDLYMETNEWNE